MPPSKDAGAVPPPFDPDAPVTNPETTQTTQTMTEDTPGPVSFLDNLDISTFDVSSIDFSELPDAIWPGEHASMGDTAPIADNFPWLGAIPAGQTSQSGPTVESNLSQGEVPSLWPVFPFPDEGDFPAFEVPDLDPMDLDLAINAPFPPTEPPLGEVQLRSDQADVLEGFEPMSDQHLGPHLSGDAETLDARTDLSKPQHHGTPSGLSSFREFSHNTGNTHTMNAAVNGGSSMEALGVWEPSPSAHNSCWPPIFPQQRPLVPRKRGGRHGQLDEDQLKRQRAARVTGVCIRCKVLNKSCYGGFPCQACQALRKPRLFRGPCTKAQFLEIIQAGSFFLRTSLYEAMVLEYLDEPRAGKLDLLVKVSASLEKSLVIKVLGQECKVPYMLGVALLKLLFFANPGGRFRKPSSSKVAETWGFLVKHVPQGDHIEFPYDFEGSQRVHWTLLSSSFCSGKHLFLTESDEAGSEENLAPSFLDGFPSGTLLDSDKALIWLSCRYRELCLFHHIQEAANQLTQKSTPDVDLAYCILIILRISMANDKLENALKACENSPQKNVIKEYLDRRKRVRVALWVYASIVISKIPSWTNFWESLPWSIDIFRESRFLKRLADSLDTFDVEGCKASTSAFNSKKTVFQRLSFLDQLPPHENDPEDQDFIEKLWARILTNTPEGVEQLRYVLSDNSSGSTDGVAQYELDEAERVFLPKTEEDQKAAIHKAFDILLSLREIPIDRDEVVEHEAFQWLVSVIEVFQLRLGLGDHEDPASTSQSTRGPATARHNVHPPIPSRAELREYMRTPKCIKASKRWKELAHILGDGILLTGKGDNDTHCFLDIATVVECGHDAEFSRLKRLLQVKGSWLKATCAKLSGLVQALRELPYPTQDVERTRDFCRQVYSATSDIIGEAALPDIDDTFHRSSVSLYLLLVRHGFMPSRSEVSERHRITWDILAESIDQTRDDILEGKVTLEDTSMHVTDGLSGAFEEVVNRFMARYMDTLGEDTTDQDDAVSDMATRLFLAMNTGFILYAKDKGFSMEGFSFEGFSFPHLPEDLTRTSLFESVFAD